MHEIFRAQVRQIIGGRMKWLMGVALLLPVLLTFAAQTSGGLGEIQEELESESAQLRITAGMLPEACERVHWEGEDRTFANDYLMLTREGPRRRTSRSSDTPTYSPINRDSVYIVNSGDIVVIDGELWMDPSHEPGSYYSINHRSRRENLEGEEALLDITVQTISAGYLFILYPQIVCLLLALLYGTSVLSHELDGKTLPYLFSRPLPRWQFVVGKYLGIVAALSVPTLLSLGASWLILGSFADAALLAGLAAGTLGALFAYNALFILFGFLSPRRGMIVALIYGIVFEFILSLMPALVNQVTVTYYLRSMVVELLDLEVPREITRMVGGASLPMALAALGAIILVTLTISSTMAARREYVVKDDA